MTTAVDLLSQLRSLGVQLHLEGETLRLNAPKGSLTPALQSELKNQKSGLMQLLRTAQGNGVQRQEAVNGNATILKADRSGRMPLSFAQQRMWFLQRLDPDSTAYNLLAVMRLEGTLDEEALERSLQSTLLRHEALRTCFLQSDGSPYTVIIDAVDWKMDKMPLDRQLAETFEAAVSRHSLLVNQLPFDLEQGPLLRALLLEEDELSHVLILCVHHIISDGWSMGVAVKELAENYRAFRLKETPNLLPLPVQYFDFSEWQRGWFESGVLDEQMRYWRQQLAGAPELAIFPVDHERPVGREGHGKRLKLTLPAELFAQLEAFSRNHGVTLFMTMLSGFMLMLSRYSGQKDVVVGSPSANRGRAELNGLIGFFVNNLVLRAQVDDRITFLELLMRVRETTLGAYENQDIPFDHLVRELQTDRNQETTPLFQTMFSFQNFPMEELKLPSLTISPLELDSFSARYDLTVEVYPVKRELQVFFDYRADIYEASTVAELQRVYDHVLRYVIESPTTTVDRIPLLPSDIRDRTLNLANNTTQRTLRYATLLDALSSHAHESPYKSAVKSGGISLSYGDLQKRSDFVASELVKAGVTRGSLVPVLLSRSVELLVGLLAVLKTGAAYVPLDPIYPKDRLAAILGDVDPVVVLTESSLLDAMPGSTGRLLLIEDCSKDDADIDGAFISTVDEFAGVDDRAYIIFTSGSTGKPKGVEVSHGALVNFLNSMQSIPGFNADDRLLAVTTISFDIAGLELFLPIYAGGEVVVSVVPGDLPKLLAEMEEERPTVMQATPALWQMIVSSGWDGDTELKALCGGEALSPQLARSICPLVKELWNMYGPTETTIWSAALKIENTRGISIPIGGPIDNTQLYVLDPHLEPVPIGVAGELYIGGAGLARGYLKQANLTADRFVANPFEEGTRLYRTGDLVRRRRDGLIEFIGRVDFQVKLRGFRIELGEIEHALRDQPEIYESVVMLHEFEGEKELIAYLVPASGQTVSFADMRRRLCERMPEYMVPSSAVILMEMPRLPNGKLDRSKLPAPIVGDVQKPVTLYVEEMGSTETAIANVFRELLRTDEISIDRRFFEFGMHSMLIVKAHDRLRRELDSELKLVSFFQYPSIAALAEHIDRRRDGKRADEYAGRA